MVTVVGNANAGHFSRSKTESKVLDRGGGGTVEGLFVYLVLRDATDNNRRLANHLSKYLDRVGRAFGEKGVRVE